MDITDIFSAFITFFTIFIIIIYLKSHSLKSYPCYFNIYFCLIITFDNVIRLFKVTKREDVNDPSPSCQIQAFVLSFFDKLFLISITGYSIINYIIMKNPKLYGEHTAKIYIILVIVGIILSLILTSLFFSEGLSNSTLESEDICYVKTSDPLKLGLDSVYTSLLLIIDLYCIIRVIITINNLIEENKIKNNEQNIKKLKCHFYRFIFDLFLNIITFGFVLLIVLKLLDGVKGSIKDFIYILLCLMCELFFTMNGELLKEVIRTITCNKFEKKDKENEKLIPQGQEEEGNDDNENENDNAEDS